MKKRVNWQPLQLRLRKNKISILREELRAAELKEEISACEVEQRTNEEWRFARDLVGHDEDLRPQEACLAEEEIIEDFLSYWTSPDDVRACVF